MKKCISQPLGILVSITLASLMFIKYFLEGGGFGEEPEGATVGWEAEEEGQKRSEEEGGDERQRL